MYSSKETVKRIMRVLHNNGLSREEIIKAVGAEEKTVDKLLEILLDFEVIVLNDGLYNVNYKTVHEFESIVPDDTESRYHEIKVGIMENLVHQREEIAARMPIEVEISFYNNVSDGNLEKLNKLYKPIGGEGTGRLSKDKIQNIRYHMVISTAVIARFCINKGMSMEKSYNLSDTYIQKADACTNEDELQRIHYQMAVDYAKRMNRLKFRDVYSIIMIKIIDYISNHLHERILIQDIADYVSRSVPYISRLFSSEMGVTASDYIMKKKSKKLLKCCF